MVYVKGCLFRLRRTVTGVLPMAVALLLFLLWWLVLRATGLAPRQP